MFISRIISGTYECLATTDYCREGKPPKVPAVLFAIDVSYPMMKEGIVRLICSNMKEMLKHLPRDMNCDKVQCLKSKQSHLSPILVLFDCYMGPIQVLSESLWSIIQVPF